MSLEEQARVILQTPETERNNPEYYERVMHTLDQITIATTTTNSTATRTPHHPLVNASLDLLQILVQAKSQNPEILPSYTHFHHSRNIHALVSNWKEAYRIETSKNGSSCCSHDELWNRLQTWTTILSQLPTSSSSSCALETRTCATFLEGAILRIPEPQAPEYVKSILDQMYHTTNNHNKNQPQIRIKPDVVTIYNILLRTLIRIKEDTQIQNFLEYMETSSQEIVKPNAKTCILLLRYYAKQKKTNTTTTTTTIPIVRSLLDHMTKHHVSHTRDTLTEAILILADSYDRNDLEIAEQLFRQLTTTPSKYQPSTHIAEYVDEVARAARAILHGWRAQKIKHVAIPRAEAFFQTVVNADILYDSELDKLTRTLRWMYRRASQPLPPPVRPKIHVSPRSAHWNLCRAFQDLAFSSQLTEAEKVLYEIIELRASSLKVTEYVNAVSACLQTLLIEYKNLLAKEKNDPNQIVRQARQVVENIRGREILYDDEMGKSAHIPEYSSFLCSVCVFSHIKRQNFKISLSRKIQQNLA
jgi:hypothetical protein